MTRLTYLSRALAASRMPRARPSWISAVLSTSGRAVLTSITPPAAVLSKQEKQIKSAVSLQNCHDESVWFYRASGMSERSSHSLESEGVSDNKIHHPTPKVENKSHQIVWFTAVSKSKTWNFNVFKVIFCTCRQCFMKSDFSFELVLSRDENQHLLMAKNDA